MTHLRLDRILTGIQAGMLGGLAMLALVCVLSMLDRRPLWSYSNLLASAWYGPRALAAGAGWMTVTGAALQLALAGIAGALFGALFGHLAGGARVALLGIFWGMLLFFLSERVYSAAAPLVAVHYPRGPALAGHIVYGVFLTGVRRRNAEAPGIVIRVSGPVSGEWERADPGGSRAAATSGGPTPLE